MPFESPKGTILIFTAIHQCGLFPVTLCISHHELTAFQNSRLSAFYMSQCAQFDNPAGLPILLVKKQADDHRMKTFFIIFSFFASSVLLPAQQKSVQDALRLYGELRNRKILSPSAIPPLPDEVLSQAFAETNRAVALIEDTLKKNHFQIVEDGNKFLRIIPEGWQDTPGGRYLDHISPVPQRLNTTEELMPKGGLNFPSVEVNEVLKIYAEYRRRIVLRSAVLPGVISLRTETPLTLEEASYALNVVLALNGIAAVDDGDKFVQVLLVFQPDRLKLGAPEPDRNPTLIAPEAVPRFSPGVFRGPRLPGSLHEHSPSSTVDGLVEYYATLTGSKYIPAPIYGKQPAMFSITVPVTKPELLYAIETTLRLQGLTITKTSDDTLTVQSIYEASRKPAK